MLILKKTVVIIGILGLLIAAEGLNRLSSLVNAFRGGDGPIYSAMLVVSILAAFVLFAALLGKAPRWLRLACAGLVALSFVLLMNAPAFPVVEQALIGTALGFLGLVFGGSSVPGADRASATV